jgi:hypothetical protein
LYDILDIISYVPNHGLSCHDYYCYQKKYRKFQEKAKEDSAGSGNFVPFPPSQERGEKKGISNPRVLSDMGLAIPLWGALRVTSKPRRNAILDR